jgi:hypothetical protein
MPMPRQNGLSLVGCALMMALLALLVIGGLMSLRHERNYFAAAWARMLPERTAVAIKSEAASIRKCIVDGRIVYSNVECGEENRTSRKVELHDTRGIEGPATPVVPVVPEAPQDVRKKMVEHAISH